MTIESKSNNPYILCIDDDGELLDTLETLLRRLFPRHPVLSAFGHGDALELAKQLKAQGQRVALFVADQLLGEKTGTHLLLALSELHPEASKAILTGHAALESAVEGLRLGIDVYLEKPVTEQELGRALRPLLQRYQLRRQQSQLLQSTRETTRRLSQLLDLVLQSLDGPVHTLLTEGVDREPARSQVLSGQRTIKLLSTAFHAHQEMFSQTPDRFTIEQLLGDSRKFVEGWQGDGLQIDAELNIEVIEHGPRQFWIGNRQLTRLVLERILHNAWRYAPNHTPLIVQTWPPILSQHRDDLGLPYPMEIREILAQGMSAISITNQVDSQHGHAARIQQAIAEVEGFAPLPGFGLIVAKQLLEALGGRLYFNGKDDDSIITVFLFLPTIPKGLDASVSAERGAHHD